MPFSNWFFYFGVERIHVCSDLSFILSLMCTWACVHARMHTHTHTHTHTQKYVSLSLHHQIPKAMSPSQVAHSPCFPTLLLWVLLTFESLPFDLFVTSTLIYQILNVFSLFSNPWQDFHGGNYFRTIVIWILSPYGPCSFFFFFWISLIPVPGSSPKYDFLENFPLINILSS